MRALVPCTPPTGGGAERSENDTSKPAAVATTSLLAPVLLILHPFELSAVASAAGCVFILLLSCVQFVIGAGSISVGFP